MSLIFLTFNLYISPIFRLKPNGRHKCIAFRFQMDDREFLAPDIIDPWVRDATHKCAHIQTAVFQDDWHAHYLYCIYQINVSFHESFSFRDHIQMDYTRYRPVPESEIPDWDFDPSIPLGPGCHPQ